MTASLSQRFPFAGAARLSSRSARNLVLSFMISMMLGYGSSARAAAEPNMEERFQDLFITAGYCTAFGAAFGTAMLAWTSEPAENLKYVAVGASMGFIGGSILGTYVVFSPLIVDSSRPTTDSRPDLLASHKSAGISLQPIWDGSKRALTGVAGSVTLATF